MLENHPLDAEEGLIHRIEELLADPAQQGNPLHEPLARLLDHSTGQRERLARLVRISDSYHCMSRDHKQSLADRYDRQLRRLEKLARISDRYQNSLRELSDALKDASLHDPLTGLGNRRFLMERLSEETERSKRTGSFYSVGVLDVDCFKSVNDRFGHESGDKVLCEIAQAIQSAVREYDLCGRWGGEEFLILLPETTLESAAQVAERVRREIKNIVVDLPEQGRLTVSASLGVTLHQAGEGFSTTLNRADIALLRAKAAGRDRIELA